MKDAKVAACAPEFGRLHVHPHLRVKRGYEPGETTGHGPFTRRELLREKEEGGRERERERTGYEPAPERQTTGYEPAPERDNRPRGL